jgi:hypothetical protein
VNWRIIRKGGCGRDGNDDDDDDGDDDNILSAVCDGLDPYHSPFLFSYPKYKNLSTTSVYASSNISFSCLRSSRRVVLKHDEGKTVEPVFHPPTETRNFMSFLT